MATEKIDPYARDIGSRIRRVRKEKLKLAQCELAKKMGISGAAVSHWECGGGFPTPGHLWKFAELSGVSMQWLTTGRGQMVVVDGAQRLHWSEVQQLERRMLELPSEELETLLQMFNDMIDIRDKRIEEKRRGALK